MSPEVTIQDACRCGFRPSRQQLTRWVAAALAGRVEAAEVTLRIVNEQEGRELNQRWRGQCAATNVLSFPFDGVGDIVPGFLGDIVVCAPVVEEEARVQGKSLEAHWAHMVVHGVLHLLGLDHQRKADAVHMEATECGVLADLGFPDPYRETVCR